jgi:predicted  nucleic acid-binding Zn-ribbon protein
MTEEVEVLWALKELDEQRSTLKTALARFPDQRAQLAGRITAEQARLEALKGRLADLQKSRRLREKDIESLTAEERKYQSQLPAVKKNEEYTALLHEIQNAKSKRSEVETQVLLMLDEEEKVQSEKPAIDRALSAAQSEADERRARIDGEERADQEKLATVEAERAKLMARLPAPTRSRYERILASRGGQAVVAISKGACGGCFRAQPPQTLQEAKRGDRLLSCDGCGRLVIWPPGNS